MSDHAMHDRARGVLLGAFIGDALGAPVELLSAREIANDKLFATAGVREMVGQLELQSWQDNASALGMSVDELGASNPTRPAGHYTDDTLLLLSVAQAIVDSGGVPPDNATCAARAVAAWRINEATDLRGLRGFGTGTQRIIETLAAGTATPDVTGKMFRPNGSNRNGGAMRIAPLGLIFAGRDLQHGVVIEELRGAVAAAIRFSHDNAEAVDGALAVAYLVARAASTSSATAAGFKEELQVDAPNILAFLATEVCMTDRLRGTFAVLADQWGKQAETEKETLKATAEAAAKASEARDYVSRYFHWDCPDHAFDIAAMGAAGLDFPSCGFTAVGAGATAVWMALRHGDHVEEALVRSIALGGDTDTLCCICGAIVGAGRGWKKEKEKAGTTTALVFPEAWVAALENGPLGRDFALVLADKLAHAVVQHRHQRNSSSNSRTE